MWDYLDKVIDFPQRPYNDLFCVLRPVKVGIWVAALQTSEFKPGFKA